MNIKLILKVIAYIILFAICISISIFVAENIDGNLGINLICITLFIFLLRLFVWFRLKSNEDEKKRNIIFVKKELEKHDSLFTWLGEEKNSDRIIFELIGDEYQGNLKKYKSVTSLKKLKRILKSKIGEDITDYYIVREYINNSRKESFGSFFKNVINKLALGSLVLAILNVVLKSDNYKLLLNIEIPTLPFKLLLYLLMFVMVLAIIFDMFTKAKNRSNVVIIILDEIIREMERDKVKGEINQ